VDQHHLAGGLHYYNRRVKYLFLSYADLAYRAGSQGDRLCQEVEDP